MINYDPSEKTLSQKLKEFLNSKAGKESIDQWKIDQEKSHRNMTLFFESSEFFDLLEKVKNGLIENKMETICSDDYDRGSHYNGEKEIDFFICNEDFCRVTESIFFCLRDQEKSDESLYFSNGYINYNGWKVDWISGQGSITNLSLNKSGIREIKINSLL